MVTSSLEALSISAASESLFLANSSLPSCKNRACISSFFVWASSSSYKGSSACNEYIGWYTLA